MSRKQIDRIRDLERQLAELTTTVRELQARPPIVINNQPPAVYLQPYQPLGSVPVQPWTWNPNVVPLTTCDAGSVGFTGIPPTVSISH